MIEDKERNILIADRDAGLFIYKGDHFTSYQAPVFFPSNDVFTLAQDETGRYWFGTHSGLSLYNPEKKGEARIKSSGFPATLEGSQINIIRPDGNGNVWIVTSTYEVFRYDLKEDKYKFDINLNGSLKEIYSISALETDLSDNLWMGTDRALIRWDEKKKESRTYTQINGLSVTNITSLFTDSKGFLWIGSEKRNGITKHFPGSEDFVTS